MKKIFKIYDIDVNKILVSNEEPYGKKIHTVKASSNDWIC